ncbi:MAG: hypothetical protein JSV58_02405 [Candidatus Bathyarchaeota archaeon]|jgi:hypothetical protein|nr:MAG: hypothetical protein JSV58_02405 [Candidatus Bathyarchaeota archaeon]
MAYFNARELIAIVMCAGLWAVLNRLFAPVVWQLTHLPLLCDFLAFTTLILVGWWTRKFGAASLTGFIVTLITLLVLQGGFQMLGFMAASILFDILTRTIGYDNCFDKRVLSVICLITFSTISAGVAGLIIGSIIMNLTVFWSIIIFAATHAVGGTIGGVFGLVLINVLKTRITIPSHLK